MVFPWSSLNSPHFVDRARKLYGEREAVVDTHLRLTYEQFFERCDRWSAALQTLGVQHGDRVAYIAPNTHAQLESFYSVPQIGAVLVPINYRLLAEDFAYLINHSGARVVCAHSDFLDPSNGYAGGFRRCSTSSLWKGRAPAGWITNRFSSGFVSSSSARTSRKATCSRSITPAERPPGPKV